MKAQSKLPDDLSSKYEFLELVGEGGMGLVYKTRHKLTNKLMAIKVLLGEKAGDLNAILRFKQEAEAASKLSHPNVVGVYDFGIANDTPFLVMEYVIGKNLADLIRTEKIDPDRFTRLFVQICAGLAHAHRNGVIHRDLKPSNILISMQQGEQETPKIADFGIAKLTSDGTTQHLTRTGDICGSPLYMSPEQCIGRTATEQSDIFSLGCVMYETITGRIPNAGENTLETIHRRTNERPPAFTASGITYPPAIEQIVMRCLEQKPEDRYSSVEKLHFDLERRVASSSSSSRRKKFRNEAKLEIKIPVAIAACGIIFGAGLLWSQNSKPQNPIVSKAAVLRRAALVDISNNNYDSAADKLKESLVMLKKCSKDASYKREMNEFLMAYGKLALQKSESKYEPADAFQSAPDGGAIARPKSPAIPATNGFRQATRLRGMSLNAKPSPAIFNDVIGLYKEQDSKKTIGLQPKSGVGLQTSGKVTGDTPAPKTHLRSTMQEIENLLH